MTTLICLRIWFVVMFFGCLAGYADEKEPWDTRDLEGCMKFMFLFFAALMALGFIATFIWPEV